MGRNKKEARNFRISSRDGFGIQLHICGDGRGRDGTGGRGAVTNPGRGEEDGVRDGRSG